MKKGFGLVSILITVVIITILGGSYYISKDKNVILEDDFEIVLGNIQNTIDEQPRENTQKVIESNSIYEEISPKSKGGGPLISFEPGEYEAIVNNYLVQVDEETLNTNSRIVTFTGTAVAADNQVHVSISNSLGHRYFTKNAPIKDGGHWAMTFPTYFENGIYTVIFWGPKETQLKKVFLTVNSVDPLKEAEIEIKSLTSWNGANIIITGTASNISTLDLKVTHTENEVDEQIAYIENIDIIDGNWNTIIPTFLNDGQYSLSIIDQMGVYLKPKNHILYVKNTSSISAEISRIILHWGESGSWEQLSISGEISGTANVTVAIIDSSGNEFFSEKNSDGFGLFHVIAQLPPDGVYTARISDTEGKILMEQKFTLDRTLSPGLFPEGIIYIKK